MIFRYLIAQYLQAQDRLWVNFLANTQYTTIAATIPADESDVETNCMYCAVYELYVSRSFSF